MHPEYVWPCSSVQRSGCRMTAKLFPSLPHLPARWLGAAEATRLFQARCFPPCFCKSNSSLRPDAGEKPQLSKQSVSSLQHDMFKMTCRSKKKRGDQMSWVQSEPDITQSESYKISDAHIWHKYKSLSIANMNFDILLLKKSEIWQFVPAAPPGRCTILFCHVLACWCYQKGWSVFFYYIETLVSWKGFTRITIVNIIRAGTKSAEVGLGRLFHAFPVA